MWSTTKSIAAAAAWTGWFSTALFAIKFGLALGGAVVGWVLGMVDYAPGQAAQAPHVLSTINALFTLIPCALFLCMVALLSIYKLNSRLVDSIARELASKREVRPEAGAAQPGNPFRTTGVKHDSYL
jgi:Na+/melibiose symporter-like transporter